jgi:alpha-L-rhamnosidase
MGYLEGYENPTTGLLGIPSMLWSQTVLIDWAGGSSRYGQSTAVNALYYGTLLGAAEVADVVGDSASALAWSQKAESIRQQVNAYLYLPDEHRYVASVYQGETIAPSPHGQAWALAYGLVPQDQVEDVASSLLDLLSSDPVSPNVELYGMFWVLRALGEAGRVPEALYLIEQYYGRLVDLGAVNWWEGFNSHLHYKGSLSHGWGGSPTWFLTTYVLGARRLGPQEWLVEPAFRRVNAVSGTLPLVDGELHVQWERQGCEGGSLVLSAPVSTTGEIILPFISSTTVVTLNHEVVWEDGVPLVGYVTGLPDGIRLSISGGTYNLTVHQDCYPVYLPVIVRQAHES